jgi:glycosyltransferase involved in cell wall biosynthesis
MISVVIPTYNRKELLSRAVDSALRQEGVDLEILIVDDGSTDGTREVWAASSDSRIRLIPEEHHGACHARNRGMEEARGDYIAFLDSDDSWQPGKLRKQLDYLEKTQADAVFCAFRHWQPDGSSVRIPGPDLAPGRIVKKQLLSTNLISTQTILGRADCLRRVGFDERFPRMQDWDFALRLTESCQVYYDNQVLADVYLQRDSISLDPEKAFKAMRMIQEKNQADYLRDVHATRTLMTAYYQYAPLAGESCGDACRTLMSPSRPFHENAYIFIRSLWLGAKASFHCFPPADRVTVV